MESMIETKEGCRRVTGVNLAHNNLTVCNDADGNVFNPFISAQNTGDPMAAGGMNRIGDQISVKGLKFKFFVQADPQRSKVYVKFYIVRMAKGDTLDRSTFFKNACGNKMIDQINTERFTVIASKRVSTCIKCSCSKLQHHHWRSYIWHSSWSPGTGILDL